MKCDPEVWANGDLLCVVDGRRMRFARFLQCLREKFPEAKIDWHSRAGCKGILALCETTDFWDIQAFAVEKAKQLKLYVREGYGGRSEIRWEP